MLASAEQLKHIDSMATRYGHIEYHGYGSRTILTADDFWQRIQHKSHMQELKTTASFQNEMTQLRIAKTRLATHLHIDKALSTILDIYGHIGLAKIDRRFVQIKNFVLLDALISRLAQLYNIPEIAIRFMTQQEVSQLLKGKSSSIAHLHARAAQRYRQKCVWIYDKKGDITIKIGSSAYDTLLRATAPPIHTSKRLKGTPVCISSKVCGRARFVFRAEDDFSPGDILVSEATDPDLAIHMSHAAAVLTEQGGVTSHASILARELGIPCIVGIKNLLRSIKEGDWLIVDTQEGVVLPAGQDSGSIVDLDLVDICKVDDFGGKAVGLHRLKVLGYRRYIPKTFLVKSSFSSSKHINHLEQILASFQTNVVAIRSSSTLEDSSSRSWAGQFPTYLNVKTKASVVADHLTALLSWNDEGKNYIQSQESRNHIMRAIIQEQIDAVWSGVCFTKCPVTNDGSKIIIECTTGLGEKLVSGKTVPMRFVYSKNAAQFEDGTQIPSTLRQNLLELIKVVLRCEDYWQSAVDIEFAINKQDQLKLLQCRPVTT